MKITRGEIDMIIWGSGGDVANLGVRGEMRSGIAQMAVAIIALLSFSACKTALSDSNEMYHADGKAQTLPTQSSVSLQTDQPVLSAKEMRQWKIYSDNNITFRYPQKITLRNRNGRIFLTHFIKFNHLDPCDYSGHDNPALRNLVDFKVSLEIVSGDGRSEVPEDHGKVKIGMLNGESFCSCHEGCGEKRYRFPIGENKTLLVKRGIISVFNGAALRYGDDDRARKRPGIIDPDMEERFFYSILSAIKIRKADRLKSN
jgi:hypothetical protein